MKLPLPSARRAALLGAALLAVTLAAPAQTPGVGIGTTAPDVSAALDVVSSTKGALLPRVAAAAGIATPAAGLLVYQTGAPAGFYYNAGAPALPRWLRLTDSDDVSYSPATGLQIGPTYTVDGSNIPTSGVVTVVGPFRADGVSVRTETLYPAAYLTAQGLRAGPLTALCYRVAQKNSTGPYQNFTLALGHTTAATPGTAFTATGMTTVYTGNVTVPAAGQVLKLVFNGSAFVWDGTSNVVVQTCFQNSAAGTSDFVTGNLVANSRIFSNTGTNQCAATGGNPSPNRPEAYFDQYLGYTLPPAPGLAGQVLTQQPSGAVTFQNPTWVQSSSTLRPFDLGARVGLGTAAPAGLLHLYTPSGHVPSYQPVGGAAELLFGSGGLTKAASIQGLDNGGYGGGLFFNVHATTGLDNWPSGTTTALTLRPSGYVGVGTTDPFSQLANTPTNIIGADGQGGNPGSLAWAANQGGYAAMIYNAGTGSFANGLAVKVDGTTGTSAALDVSKGAQTAPGTPLLRVLADGRVGVGTNSPTGFAQLTNTPANTLGSDANGGNTGAGGGSLSWYMNTNGFVGQFYNDSPLPNANGLAVKVDGTDPAALAFDVSKGSQTANGPSLLAVRAGGGVGVGTNVPAPNYRLHVAPDDAAENGLYVGLSGASAAQSLKLEHNGSNFIVRPAAASSSTTVLENSAGPLSLNPQGGLVSIANASATQLSLTSTSPDPSGLIALTVPATNTTCPGCSEFLWFNRAGTGLIGSVAMNGAGTGVQYNTTSDKRLKENIQPTRYGLRDLLRLEVKDYTFVGQPRGAARSTGLLAQDLFRVYPEAVKEGDHGPAVTNQWAVDYGKLTPLLIQAVQDQQRQIEALQAQNAALQQAAADAAATRAAQQADHAALLGLQHELARLRQGLPAASARR